jgi:putative endonuclease
MPFCYILQCSDGTFYTGWTTDLERRLKTHNAGRGAKYTKLRRPVKLVYSEELANRSVAQKREMAIKRLSRAKKIVLIKDFSNHE